MHSTNYKGIDDRAHTTHIHTYIHTSGGAGSGIQLARGRAAARALRKRAPGVLQRYIDHPMLVNGHRFTLRLYALITSVLPLKLLVNRLHGIAKFTTVAYGDGNDVAGAVLMQSSYRRGNASAGHGDAVWPSLLTHTVSLQLLRVPLLSISSPLFTLFSSLFPPHYPLLSFDSSHWFFPLFSVASFSFLALSLSRFFSLSIFLFLFLS
jgi:hypothetical protein